MLRASVCAFSALSSVADSRDRRARVLERSRGACYADIEQGPLLEAPVASLSLWTGRSRIGSTWEQLSSPRGWGEKRLQKPGLRFDI